MGNRLKKTLCVTDWSFSEADHEKEFVVWDVCENQRCLLWTKGRRSRSGRRKELNFEAGSAKPRLIQWRLLIDVSCVPCQVDAAAPCSARVELSRRSMTLDKVFLCCWEADPWKKPLIWRLSGDHTSCCWSSKSFLEEGRWVPCLHITTVHKTLYPKVQKDTQKKLLKPFSHQGMQMKTTVRYHYKLMRMAEVEEIDNAKWYWGQLEIIYSW